MMTDFAVLSRKRVRVSALVIFVVVVFQVPRDGMARGTPAERDYVEALRGNLPAVLCAEGSYFRECPRLSADQCLGSVMTFLDRCLNESPFAKFGSDQGNHATQNGYKIGNCVARQFIRNVSFQNTPPDRCRKLLNWR